MVISERAIKTEGAGRVSGFRSRRQAVIAGAEVVALFLALIKTVASIYQVKALPGNLLPSDKVIPIVTGSVVAACSCLVLTVLYFFRKTLIMHVAFVLAIVGLVLVKVFLFKN